MAKIPFTQKLKRISLELFFFNCLTVTLFLVSLLGLRVMANYEWLYSQIFAQTNYEQNTARLVLGEDVDPKTRDARILALEDFFNKYNSPLLPYAEKIVNLSDKYGFHYGLLPAIAMVESGLCRVTPVNSYNCWGWGIYGKTVTRFSSYDEAIDTVAKGIKEEYFDRGYTTPEKIMSKYNPTNHNNWLGGVNFFLEKLN